MQALMLSKGKQTKITYINHFNNDKTLIWDLTHLKLSDYIIKKEWLQKNDFDETMVLKDVIYLKPSTAIFGNDLIDLFILTPEHQQMITEEQQEVDDYLTELFKRK